MPSVARAYGMPRVAVNAAQVLCEGPTHESCFIDDRASFVREGLRFFVGREELAWSRRREGRAGVLRLRLEGWV